MGDHADDAANFAIEKWTGDFQEELEDGGTYYPRYLGPRGPGPCPSCGADTVLRTGKYGKFYGCSTFPVCYGTRPYH